MHNSSYFSSQSRNNFLTQILTYYTKILKHYKIVSSLTLQDILFLKYTIIFARKKKPFQLKIKHVTKRSYFLKKGNFN